MVASPGRRDLLGVSISQRITEIERRLAELRQARPEPGGETSAKLLAEAQRHAREADQHWRESIAHTQLAQQWVVHAFRSAARAHDHAADANERSARAGIGDVAEHMRRAAFHRDAAEADRRRASETENSYAGPASLA